MNKYEYNLACMTRFSKGALSVTGSQGCCEFGCANITLSDSLDSLSSEFTDHDLDDELVPVIS